MRSVLRLLAAAMVLALTLLAAGFLAPSIPRAAAQQIAAPAQSSTDSNAAASPQNFLYFLFDALQVRYTLAFLVISFTFVAYLVMNMLGLRREAICPPHLAAVFETQLNDNKLQEAYELAKNDDSMLGQMLAAGMHNLQHGFEKAEEAMSQVGEDENLKLEQRLSFLSLVGTIAPMVGLLGTVDGMVQSFMTIAQRDIQPKPSELAQGISMALVTTLVGLVLAIPAIVAFHLLKNRLTRLVMETVQQVTQLMSRFENRNKTA